MVEHDSLSIMVCSQCASTMVVMGIIREHARLETLKSKRRFHLGIRAGLEKIKIWE